MNRNKRLQNTVEDNCEDERSNKLQRIATWLSTTTTDTDSITSFEDLSNDLIYAIFGYLDTYHMLESFSDLNTRIQYLVIYLTAAIDICISTLSKSSLEKYYTHFIQPNKHRIRSLHLSNPFALDFFCSLTENFSKYSQLQSIHLDDLEPSVLENVINELTFVPNLFSLTIYISYDTNKINIYHQIFQLSQLKYCKISFEENIQFGQLPICTNPSSPLEHLVIMGKCYLNELHALLSYAPQLRRLSVTHINATYNQTIENDLCISNNLISVSLKLDCVKFDSFAQFAKNHLGQVKTLYITTARDMIYLEADRWEQLILSYIPCLQIFDFKHTIKNYLDYPDDVFETLFCHFKSSFWHQRQWFFAHDAYSGEYLQGIFYSIQPYRRKCFSLASKTDSEKNIGDERTVFSSVRHVIIQDDQMLANFSKFFPNATELTLSNHCSLHSKWFSTNCIIYPRHLNKITIDSVHLDFRSIVNLLFYTPNIHTLTITSIKLFPRDYVPLQASELFHLVSEQNKIKNIIFNTNVYSLQTIKLLINLCSQLQHITIGISERSLEPTIRFLLSETNETTCYLSSICILGVDAMWIEKLKLLIQSKPLVNDYSIKIINQKLYIWW